MPVAGLMSIEEFERLTPPEDCRYELVDGEVVTLPLLLPIRSLTIGTVSRTLGRFVEERGLGLVFPSRTGFVLSREPANLRGPDMAFISAARLKGLNLRANIPGAPDLAVDVISPSDTIRALRYKIDQYLAAGCRAAWALDPDKREAQVFEPGERPRVLLAEDELTCPELLPGFAVLVDELFPSL